MFDCLCQMWMSALTPTRNRASRAELVSTHTGPTRVTVHADSVWIKLVKNVSVSKAEFLLP